MSQSDTYEVYAIRYGHYERRSPQNFLGGDPHDCDMPLDYFVWAIVGAGNTYVVDTGFDTAMADTRGRHIVRPVEAGLATIGIDQAQVTDVIISHMHYDHCGNHSLFPNAKFHLQDEEMAFATGRCMCDHATNHPFAVEDVTTMVRRVFEGRVRFHERDSQIAPGLSVHWVGGHSRGLQVVRVMAARGPVILGSDAAHFYANIERRDPFPVLDRVGDVLAGFDRMAALTVSADHIVPGHDPLVLARYPLAKPDLTDVVRLDIAPRIVQ